jgi:hypothetical protein
MVLLAVVLGVAGMCGALAFFVQRGHVDLHRVQIKSTPIALVWLLVISVAILGFWMFSPVTTILPTSNLFRLYVVATLMLVGALPLLQFSPPTLAIPNGLIIGLAGLLCVGVLSISLGRVPPSTYYDEAYIVGQAYGWAMTNNANFNAMTGQNENISFFPYGYYLLGLWIKATGINESTARLGAILLGWCALPFLWITIRRAFNPNIAIFACVLFALLCTQQTYIRADTIVALAVAIGLWALYHAGNSFVGHFLAGFAFACATHGHFLGLSVAIAVGVIITLQYLWQLITQRRWIYKPFWGMLLGGLMGGLVFALSLALAKNQSIFALPQIIQELYILEANIGGGADFFTRFRNSLAQWGGDTLLLYPLVGLTLFSSPIVVWLYPPMRRWVLIGVISMVAYLALNPKPVHTYYFVHHLPLVIWIASAMMALLYHQLNRWLVVWLMVLLIGLQLAQMAVIARDSGSDELIAIGYEIDNLLPSEVEAVIGWEVYYWGLNQRTFYATYNFIADKSPIKDMMARGASTLPQAVIVTVGLDEVHQSIQDYIVIQAFKRLACFDALSFGWRVELYIELDILPGQQDKGCQN